MDKLRLRQTKKLRKDIAAQGDVIDWPRLRRLNKQVLDLEKVIRRQEATQ